MPIRIRITIRIRKRRDGNGRRESPWQGLRLLVSWTPLMRHPWLLKLSLLLLAGAFACQAQDGGQFHVSGLNNGLSWFDSQGGTNFSHNGGIASNQTSVVTFDEAWAV